MPHHCLADIGGPFYAPEKPFRNWSALPFYQLDLANPPYIDQQQLDWGVERALTYLEVIAAQGYTGFAIDNVAHLVTFDDAPMRIYAADSAFRLRALIYRAAFSRLFARAEQLGLDVFVTTDMQWSTPPVATYVGRLAAGAPRLDAINGWALDELFTTFPQVRGLIVRTGEAGGAHNQAVGYASQVLYRTTASMRALIASLLPLCERHQRLLIMRTWSIGIGELGDLHWSPARYRAVFGGFDSPQLLASIKHTPSDFFRLLPHNPTLGLPGPPQLVELQNRREYELFGMVPSSIAALHQRAIQRAAASSQFAGVWAWNSTGGWGGGRAAIGASGWTTWTELSSALTAVLVREPAIDTAAFVRNWCAARFGGAFGAAVSAAYLDSDVLIEHGWYSGALAHAAPALSGIYLPSLLWIWWMRPTASLLTWSYLMSAIDDRHTVARARRIAAERLRWHAEQLAAAHSDAPEAAAVTASVRYLADVVAVADAIRSLLEGLFEAARLGRRAEWDREQRTLLAVRAAIARHLADWGGNVDFPPLELEEIGAFLGAIERTPSRMWLQARAASLLMARARSSNWPQRAISAGGGVIRSALLSVLSRRRTATAAAMLLVWLMAPLLGRRALQAGLPWLNRHCYILPSIFFEAGPALREWTD